MIMIIIPGWARDTSYLQFNSENRTTELHYESQQQNPRINQFPAAEGLFDLAAFKLSLLFSMTTSVHSSASSDFAEAWMNNPFNTQQSIYSQHQHCTLDHHSLSMSYNTALLFVSSLVLPELLIAIFWNQSSRPASSRPLTACCVNLQYQFQD